jgi:hypothetical protein
MYRQLDFIASQIIFKFNLNMGSGAPREAIEWAEYSAVVFSFLVWWKGVFAGVFAKNGVQMVVF